MAKVIQVIYTEDRRGDGTEKDPMRLVPQLWTLGGELICESECTINPKLDGSGHFENKAYHDVLMKIGN